MSAQRGQVVWSAEAAVPSSLAQRYGLSTVSYTDAGEPDDLDQEEGEAVVSRFEEVALIIGEDQDQGPGSLCVTNKRICWRDRQQPGNGLAAEFTEIGLHGVASDSPVYGRPSIYLQLAGEDESSFSSDPEATQRELRLVPADSDALEDIFRVLCEVAAQNPDPEQEGDEDETDMFYDEAEVLKGSDAQARAAMLDHFDSMLQIPQDSNMEQLLVDDPDRFEDPDGFDGAGDPDGLDDGIDPDGLHEDGDVPVPHVPVPHVPHTL